MRFFPRDKGGLAVSQFYRGPERAFLAQSLALFDAMEPEPEIGRKRLIDETIRQLIAEEIWGELDSLFLFAAHSEQPGLIDWRNPDRNGTAVNAPTFTTDRGFFTDGSTSYIDTNFIADEDAVSFQPQNLSMGIYSRTGTNNNDWTDFGARTGNNNRQILIQLSSGGLYRIYSTGSPSSGFSPPITGLHIARRIDSGESEGWKNGIKIFSVASGGGTSLGRRSIYIGGLNSDNTPSLSSSREFSLFVAGSGMTDAKQEALSQILVDFYLEEVGAKL